MRAKCSDCGFYCDTSLILGSSGFCTNLDKRQNYYNHTHRWKPVYHPLDRTQCDGFTEWRPEHRERNRLIAKSVVQGFLRFIPHPEQHLPSKIGVERHE